jgi:HPt (histidine-containing phosphotransfer) domain-containing protein
MPTHLDSAGEPCDPVFDPEAALNLAGDDRELLQRLIKLFFTHTPALMADLESAVAGDDAAAIELIAHRLAGSAAMFGAHPARLAARKLEEIGRTGDLRTAVDAHAAVEAEIARLVTSLEAFQS